MTKIWCLFSIKNDYDQPANNLVCWWSKKPSVEQFCAALGVKLGEDDETTVNAVKIWAGQALQLQHAGTEYRLEEVKEADCLDSTG